MPFPLGLVITNQGGKTAEKTSLRITHPRNFQIHSKGLKADVQLISTPNGLKVTTTIPLGDIHPGAPVHLDGVIYATIENTLKMPIQFEFRDNVPAELTFTELLTYQIDAALSAKDYSEVVSPLCVVIGKPDDFRNKRDHLEMRGDQWVMHRMGR